MIKPRAVIHIFKETISKQAHQLGGHDESKDRQAGQADGGQQVLRLGKTKIAP